MVCIGAILGTLILLGDLFLEKINPISDYTLCLWLLECIYHSDYLHQFYLGDYSIFHRKENTTDSNPEISLQNGILVSSGLIAGESLMGIILAFIAGAGIKSLNLGLDPI